MNAELAEVICLTSHGSLWLSSTDPDPPALERSNSTLQFVNSVNFHVAKNGHLSRDERQTSVADWLRSRRRAGVEGLSLIISNAPSTGDQPALAAFANAGQWGLAAHSKKRTEFWRPRWAVTNRDAPDRRIWTVNYEGKRVAPTAHQRVDLDEASQTLRDQLAATATFAEDEGLDTWTNWFRNALNGADEIPYHSDMLPSDYTSAERRVVAMAAQAWVFGGMGSWNDLGFREPDRQRRYKDLTRALYDAVLRAFVAGVNRS
ncbi:MAG: hypothetical protein ACREJ3_05695 [Polyangiaceae bacterium]